MERFEEAIPLYLTACTVEGKTDRTVQSYAETLRQFRRAGRELGLPENMEAFGPAHVYLFMGWVRERGVSAGTQHRRQREVKAFFSWCRRMDYVEENPFMRVPMVRREQKVIQPFTKDDLTTLLAACNPQTYVGSRMRAMILFLLDTGVRSSELVSIRLDDVVFDEGRVRVLQGKGRKQRWTAISEVALAALRTYLEDFRGWSEGHLFQTVDGRPLRNHHMNVMFTRHGARAGVRQGQPPPLPPHLRYLGDSGQCPRARCPVPPWAFEPDDGPSLLRDLRLRTGGKGARCLQSGDAAVGG